MIFNSKSTIAIVTGSSRGIGKSIKNKLETKGITVIGVYRNAKEDKFDKKCDVGEETDVKNLVNDVINEYGKIDVLINNAGIVTRTDISKTKLSDWNNVLSTNLTGPFLLCKYVLPHMKNQQYGKIVNVSAIAARSYSKTASVEYTVSKYGLIGLTKQLAYKYGQFGINVNCICPSQTKTEMLINNLTTKEILNIEKHIPLGKIAEPEQIAEVVNFLCSDQSSYIHGSVIDINGGQI